MILTKTILKSIKSVLDGASIDSYLFIAPQTQDYPFVTFLPISINTEYTFNEVIETAIIQFTIFDDEMDISNIFTIGTSIETLFENYTVTDGGNKIFCTHKVGENGPIYNTSEHYNEYIIELEFKCQRAKL